MRVLSAIALAITSLVLACSATQSGPDGGGVDGSAGCAAASDCSAGPTLDSVCVSGDCLPFDGQPAIQKLGLSFRAAPEIMSAATSFSYFAIYPSDTSGNAVECRPLIEGTIKPDAPALNLVQSNGVLLGKVSDYDIVTATRDLPAFDSYIFYGEVLDASGKKIGVCCRAGAKVPSMQIGLSICPSNMTGRCQTGGSK